MLHSEQLNNPRRLIAYEEAKLICKTQSSSGLFYDLNTGLTFVHNEIPAPLYGDLDSSSLEKIKGVVLDDIFLLNNDRSFTLIKRDSNKESFLNGDYLLLTHRQILGWDRYVRYKKMTLLKDPQTMEWFEEDFTIRPTSGYYYNRIGSIVNKEVEGCIEIPFMGDLTTKQKQQLSMIA